MEILLAYFNGRIEKVDMMIAAKREAKFYREQLELICRDPRRTRARRLAESALAFWDQMRRERTNGKVHK